MAVAASVTAGVALALAGLLASASAGACKCCPPGQILSADPNFTCVPAGSNYLIYEFDDGFPSSCSGNLSRVEATQDVRVDCIDVAMDDRDRTSLKGVVCEEESEKFFVPEVHFVRKCCPPERRYSNFREGCWKEDFPDDNSTVESLRAMFLNDTNAAVNLQIGVPTCAHGTVLVDIFLHHRHVWRQDSESVLLKHQGPAGDILLVPEDFCVDLVTEDDYSLVVRACQDATVVCDIDKKHCINKCCKDGHSLEPGAGCVRSKNVFDLQFYTVRPPKPPEPVFVNAVAITYSFLGCKYGKFSLDPSYSPSDLFFVTDSGYLLIPNFPSNKSLVHWKDFCLENLMGRVLPFLCFPGPPSKQPEKTFHFKLIAFGLVVSSLFLLITFLVYACLPSLHNLHGQTLMCHVAALLAAYSFLVASQLLSGVIVPQLCLTISYGILFFFLAAFSWLNVICFDIWWTFGVIKSHVAKMEESKRKFLLYSLYAWLLPLAITLGTFLVDYYTLLPNAFLPNMGSRFCWFTRDTHGKTIFFNLPVMIQVTANIIFFALTIRNCSRIKSELRKMQNNSSAKLKYRTDINKLAMNTKLFVVMGITWGCEVVTWYVQGDEDYDNWWYILDAANIFQGFFIFLIFVIKKKVIRAMKMRIHELAPPCFVPPPKHRPSTSTIFTTVASSDCRASGSQIKK